MLTRAASGIVMSALALSLGACATTQQAAAPQSLANVDANALRQQMTVAKPEPSYWQQSKEWLTGAGSTSDAKPQSQPKVKTPDDEKKGLFAMARLAESEGHYSDATRLFKEYAGKYPDEYRAHQRLGIIAARQGKFEDADGHFEHALELAPDNPKLLSDAGYALYLQHRLDESERLLKRAFRMRPHDSAICKNLALVAGSKGKFVACLTLFKRVDTEAQAYANLGYVYAQQGNYEKAIEQYSVALTLDKSLRPAAEAMVQIAKRRDASRALDRQNLRDGEMIAKKDGQPVQTPEEQTVEPSTNDSQPSPIVLASGEAATQAQGSDIGVVFTEMTPAQSQIARASLQKRHYSPSAERKSIARYEKLMQATASPASSAPSKQEPLVENTTVATSDKTLTTRPGKPLPPTPPPVISQPSRSEFRPVTVEPAKPLGVASSQDRPAASRVDPAPVVIKEATEPRSVPSGEKLAPVITFEQYLSNKQAAASSAGLPAAPAYAHTQPTWSAHRNPANPLNVASQASKTNAKGQTRTQ